MFVMVWDDEQSCASYRKLAEDPLWRNLKAVRSNQVHRVDPRRWFMTDVFSLQGS
ncbi:hypothetical protein GK047_16690 [Paenibacillus sp. SYP-B3998]|uniref:Fe/B12 periplasmic-binding domain-containing protein n=1 Tax=Paenibacillus sp. SYP-B3998 TaxID=2678564 RepID=A0A6G3ZZW0_9BACL|nr:hypothetical protein [Paenibacillus sp. SYP-B3998]NEW07640.1 hypothetical protein [Paenibacillus sp. SYP-B3998]